MQKICRKHYPVMATSFARGDGGRIVGKGSALRAAAAPASVFGAAAAAAAATGELDMARYEAHRRLFNQDFMILFAGPAGVGKTSLINQTLLEPNGQRTSRPVEMTVEDSYDTLINGTRVHVIDTGGQSDYRGLVLEKMGRANMVVFVFDVSNAEASLQELEHFAELLVYCRKVLPPVVVVANKCDRVAGDWHESLSAAQLSVLDNVSTNHFEAVVVGTHCDAGPDGYRLRSTLSQRSTTRLRDTLASAMTLLSSRSMSSSQSDIGSVSSLCTTTPSPPPVVRGTSRSCNTSPRPHYKSNNSASAPSSPRPKLSPRSCSTGHVPSSTPSTADGFRHMAGSSNSVHGNRHAVGPMNDADDHIGTAKCLIQ